MPSGKFKIYSKDLVSIGLKGIFQQSNSFYPSIEKNNLLIFKNDKKKVGTVASSDFCLPNIRNIGMLFLFDN